jgi:predicted nucleic acid-binding protein
MKVFLDTSSLLKLYHHEVGTERLLNTLSQGVEEIYLSELAILEFHSAI